MRLSILDVVFAILILSSAVCGCAPAQRTPAPKPLPPFKSGLSGKHIPNPFAPAPTPKTAKTGISAGQSLPTDIIDSADYYAQAVAAGNWPAVAQMSSGPNKLNLEQVVKPKISEKIHHWGSPGKGRASFENSVLVKENFDDQIVLESLEYSTGSGAKKQLYIQFRITKVSNKFIVSNTQIVEKPRTIPG